MKKVLLLTGVLLMVVAGSALAAPGINLSWNDCYFSGLGSIDKVDACDALFGVNKLLIDVNPDGVIDGVNGAQGVVDVQTDSPTLPDYWHYETGGCRQGKLAAVPTIGVANCPEPWSQVGQATGAANFVPDVNILNRGRITWIVAVPGLVTIDYTGGALPDWYILDLDLQRAPGTCTGCATPACIAANEVRLTRQASDLRGDVIITQPAISQYVTWQGGGAIACPGAVPTKTSTWGQVKSLYR